MTLFVKDNIKAFHVHIPRTGVDILKRYYSRMVMMFIMMIMKTQLWNQRNTSTYPLYEMLDQVANSKQFAVVRDPFKRFASAAHCYNQRMVF